MMSDTRKPLLRAADLAARTGLSARYWQKLFAAGEIDWATQPGGPGTPILFDEAGFNDWDEGGRNRTTRRRSAAPQHPVTPSARRRGWREPTSLEQRIRAKLKVLSRQR
jgi:hypothetical protein